MMLRRLLAILVVVILGSIAAQDLFNLLSHLAPVLIVLVIALAIGGGWFSGRRRL